MPFTAISSSGAKLRASDLATWFSERTPVTATKTGDTSRASTVSRTADPDLAVTLTAGTWEINGILILQSAANAAGDFSFEWTYPADASITVASAGPSITLASGTTAPDTSNPAASLDGATPAGPFEFGASTSFTSVLVMCRTAIVTPGAVTVAWAQQSSNGSSTSLKGGSTITARLVA